MAYFAPRSENRTPIINFTPVLLNRCSVVDRGSQDVLMSVVPSIPPTIAVTCTTELSLFALDGTRINPTGRSVQTSCASGTNQMDPSDHPRAMAEEAHDRDIRCLAVSTAGDRVATG